MSETKLTPQEMYAISLCVAWTAALSPDDSDEAVHRRKFARVATDGLRRVYGEGFHEALRRAATTEGGTTR